MKPAQSQLVLTIFINSSSSEQFLKKQGLGNEVPFFICPYRPEEDVEMKRLERQLIKQLDQHGVSVLHINLYDLSIEMLKERGIWDRILNAEQNVVKEKFKELSKESSILKIILFLQLQENGTNEF